MDSKIKQIIIEETQRVLIERELEKYIKESFSKLLAEGKSQKEIEELLAEGLKDTAKRLAIKYGLPLMAVASILTSTPAFAGAPPEPSSREAAAATQELPPEEEKSFWDEVGDWLMAHAGDPLRGDMGRTGLKPVAPEQWQQPRDVYGTGTEQGPETAKSWKEKSSDLLRKVFGETYSEPHIIDGSIYAGNFIAKKTMKDAWGKAGLQVPDSIDVSDVGIDSRGFEKADKQKYIIYKAIVDANPGVK